jgi:hypothetical protein
VHDYVYEGVGYLDEQQSVHMTTMYTHGLTIWDAQYAHKIMYKGVDYWDACYMHKIIDKGVDYLGCTICARDYG